jgi:guanine nucleotide-binding protein subunit alpha
MRLYAHFPAVVDTRRQQMRLMYRAPFTTQEVETFRQLIFGNLTDGIRLVCEAMADMNLELAPENVGYLLLVNGAHDIRDGEAFLLEYLQPLKSMWADAAVQEAVLRGNEAALPEKYNPCSAGQLRR